MDLIAGIPGAMYNGLEDWFRDLYDKIGRGCYEEAAEQLGKGLGGQGLEALAGIKGAKAATRATGTLLEGLGDALKDPRLRRALTEELGALGTPEDLAKHRELLEQTADAARSIDEIGDGIRDRGPSLGQQQGREFRTDNLEVNEFDTNQPKHVRGWLENERRRIQSGNGPEYPRNPPGYVQGHGRSTPAREGFDYSNSNLQLDELNKLEEAIRRRSGRE